MSNWGEDRRHAARFQLEQTATIGVTERVIQAYATLTAECRRRGHGLQDKLHAGDRWIAATAVAWELPLLSGDRIFRGAPGVQLFDVG